MIDWKIFKLEISDRFNYIVSLSPQKDLPFELQLDDILEKYNLVLNNINITEEELVFAKIFVTDCINQKNIMERHDLFQCKFKNCGFSIIEQPPLDGSKINILFWFIKGEKIFKYRLENAFYLHIDKYLHIYHCVRCNSKAYYDLSLQTNQAFMQHKYLLKKYNMSVVDNCIRTWLYIRDIDKNYPYIVQGRNDFLGNNQLNINTHFIASTGIEGNGESKQTTLCIDLYSIKGIKQKQIKYLKALDFLNPTYEYGVSFERGTCISYRHIQHIYISGTASIDKNGKCIYKGDVIKQLERIFVNIENLLSDVKASLNDIGCMIVYLRDISDYNSVKEYINEYYDSIPCVIVHAKVCRPEWLVEIECLALKKI